MELKRVHGCIVHALMQGRGSASVLDLSHCSVLVHWVPVSVWLPTSHLPTRWGYTIPSHDQDLQRPICLVSLEPVPMICPFHLDVSAGPFSLLLPSLGSMVDGMEDEHTRTCSCACMKLIIITRIDRCDRHTVSFHVHDELAPKRPLLTQAETTLPLYTYMLWSIRASCNQSQSTSEVHFQLNKMSFLDHTSLSFPGT